MARPLSEQKRDAILLTSAAGLVATMGTGAPTAKIAKVAGLAEGTLFTYFASKDELLNQLYLGLKAEVGDAMLESYPSNGSVRERIRHVWDRFIDWGAAHPMKAKAIRQLSVSDRITEDSRRRSGAVLRDVNGMLEQSLADGVLKDQPPAFIGAVLQALAETTLEFIARDPEKREQYKQAGFQVFLNIITK